ncbi:hypothetical protein ACLB2K_027402 [Fragaria x ananassa]
MPTLARNWKKETKKLSMFSEFLRRNSSTLVLQEEKMKKSIMEEESFKRKSLYLCFEEDTTNNVYVIQSIRLSHLLAPPVHGGNDLKLQRVAYRCGPITVVPRHMSTDVVGSKIIFFGGLVPPEEKDTASTLQNSPSKEVCVFETDPSIDPNPKLQPSHVFKINRGEPVLMEVDNKLYRFGCRWDCDSFEVLESKLDDWLPLDVPPRRYRYGFNHAIAGTKILLWSRKTGVYMFDVTYPEKGWTELDPYLGSYIHSIDGSHQLFVKLKSGHGDGEGFLMFSVNLKQPHIVLVSHMSHTCDSLKHMQPLQLQLPADCPPNSKAHVSSRCKFFHLGGEKVGIVFSCDRLRHHYKEIDDYNPYNVTPSDSEKARVLVIIFEYEFVEESMDIKYSVLSSRCLEYSTKIPEEEYYSDSSQLIGVERENIKLQRKTRYSLEDEILSSLQSSSTCLPLQYSFRIETNYAFT